MLHLFCLHLWLMQELLTRKAGACQEPVSNTGSHGCEAIAVSLGGTKAKIVPDGSCYFQAGLTKHNYSPRPESKLSPLWYKTHLCSDSCELCVYLWRHKWISLFDLEISDCHPYIQINSDYGYIFHEPRQNPRVCTVGADQSYCIVGKSWLGPIITIGFFSFKEADFQLVHPKNRRAQLVQSLDFQCIYPRFEPQCLRGVFWHGFLASPSFHYRITTVKDWRSQPVDKGQGHLTDVKDPSLSSRWE